MEITPHIARDAKVVQRYGPGRFTISGETFAGGVLVSPTAVSPWTDAELESWTEATLAPVLALMPAPEILLVGTGTAMRLLPRALRPALRAHGIGCDAMDTGAACRTYNILLAEGRRVAAVLLAVG
ncbi:MAG: Mth938-like domain-containing protein [Alphaproteobacteria bacterium]